MRLDTCNFGFLSKSDWRILYAIESESKTHEIVPIKLISKRTKLDPVSIDQACALLMRFKLLRREGEVQHGGASQENCNMTGSTSSCIDTNKDLASSQHRRRGRKGIPLGTLGYILGFGGLDYLALHFFKQKNSLSCISNSRLGVGKEADIHVGERLSPTDGAFPKAIVVKFHRLGRTSFRSVRTKRDYHLGKGANASSWMHLSMLAAAKEWAFLKALYQLGFSVPIPVDHNRHAIVMERIDGLPLNQVTHLLDPQRLYHELVSMIVAIARLGLVHGDFNEFNVLVRNRDESPVLIDFPQMVSIKHRNAAEDISCIRKWFKRNFPTVDLDFTCQGNVSKTVAPSSLCSLESSDELKADDIRGEDSQESKHTFGSPHKGHAENKLAEDNHEECRISEGCFAAFDSNPDSGEPDARDFGSSGSCVSENDDIDYDSGYDSPRTGSCTSSLLGSSSDSESVESLAEDREFPPYLSMIIKELEETGQSPLDEVLKASGYTHGLEEELDKYWGFLAIQ